MKWLSHIYFGLFISFIPKCFFPLTVAAICMSICGSQRLVFKSCQICKDRPPAPVVDFTYFDCPLIDVMMVNHSAHDYGYTYYYNHQGCNQNWPYTRDTNQYACYPSCQYASWTAEPFVRLSFFIFVFVCVCVFWGFSLSLTWCFLVLF